MRFPELAAFEEEARGVEATLAGVPTAAWGRTALGEWTVTELTAHLVRAVTRVDAYLDVETDADEPAVDRVGYWRFDLAAEAPAVAARAREEAAGADDPLRLVEGFSSGWRASSSKAGALPPQHLLSTIRGPMRLDEYVATRVVELVVHHMDLRAALDLPPGSAPAAERLTMHVLESLLGSPRPRNLGRDRFIRTATGRLASDDPRFPVLR